MITNYPGPYIVVATLYSPGVFILSSQDAGHVRPFLQQKHGGAFLAVSLSNP